MEHPLPMGGQHWDGFDGVGLLSGALRQAFLPSRGTQGEGDGRKLEKWKVKRRLMRG